MLFIRLLSPYKPVEASGSFIPQAADEDVSRGVGSDCMSLALVASHVLKSVHAGPATCAAQIFPNDPDTAGSRDGGGLTGDEAAANEPSLGDRVFHDDVAVTGGENPGRRMGKHRERGRAKSTPRTGRVAVHSGEGSATDAFADGPGKDVVG